MSRPAPEAERPGAVREVLRRGWPDTPQRRRGIMRLSLLLHLHPASLPRAALALRHTFCLGGLSALLFLVEVVTGVLLMLYVGPGPEAYAQVAGLGEHVAWGLVREIHRWAAVALIVSVTLHLLRVFLTGSYQPPRRLNWVVGVLLFVLTLLLTFSGYLLLQDQRGLWATVVAARMAGSAPLVGAQGPGALVAPGGDLAAWLQGGPEIGLATVYNFYVLHCLLLPLLALGLMGWHFWRVRQDGGVGPL